MRKRRKKPYRVPTIQDWLILIEHLIEENSTPARTRGKYKGHSETNTLAWVRELASVCQSQIIHRNRGKDYDGNMALARVLGLVLCAWYAQIHRAKGMDPNRPLDRRIVFKQLAEFRAELAVATTDDRIMGEVWGHKQNWNFPLGRGARGGTFV